MAMPAGDTAVESITIKASPEVVYNAIADVSRMPSWSPELRSVRVPYDGPLKFGDVFAGVNKKGIQIWRTTSKVTVSEPPKVFEIKVTGGRLPVSTWRYEIEAVDGGSRLTVKWIDDRAGFVGDTMRVAGFVASGVWNRDKHNSNGMRVTLEALKKDLESQGAAN